MGLSGMFQQYSCLRDWPLTPSTAQGLGLLKCLIYDTDGLSRICRFKSLPWLHQPSAFNDYITRQFRTPDHTHIRLANTGVRRTKWRNVPYFYTIYFLSLSIYFFGRCMSSTSMFRGGISTHFFRQAVGKKGKPADLIPFASPSSLDLSLFCFSFWLFFSVSRLWSPKNYLHKFLRFFHFPDKLLGRWRRAGCITWWFFYSSSSIVLQILFSVSMCSLALLLRCFSPPF